MVLHLGNSAKLGVIIGKSNAVIRTLAPEDYQKPILGIGKLGFIKIGRYYIEPRTTAVLGEGEVGYMIIGKEGVA